MRFLEQAQIAAGILPSDLASGDQTGDWVSVEQYNRVAVVFFKDGGTAGEDPTLVIQEATDAAGSGAKNLSFTTIYRKQGSDLFLVGQWTETTQSAQGEYTNATSAEEECIWVIEFDAADLDTDNGFKFIRANIDDIGTNSQLGCVLYILSEPRYADSPANMAGVLS